MSIAFSTLVFALLFSIKLVASDETTKHNRIRGRIIPQNRQLKNKKGRLKRGGTSSSNCDETSPELVENSGYCVKIEAKEIQDRFANPLDDVIIDEVCRTNDMACGCCRIHQYLTLDASNTMADTPCICNNHTTTKQLDSWADLPGENVLMNHNNNQFFETLETTAANYCVNPPANIARAQLAVVAAGLAIGCSHNSDCIHPDHCCWIERCICATPNGVENACLPEISNSINEEYSNVELPNTNDDSPNFLPGK